MPRALALLLGALLFADAASAGALRLFSGFGDHAVLQRERPVPLRGWAAPGETVELAFGPHRAQAVAGPDGAWRAELPALPASAKPETLTVRSGAESVTAREILVGEVWFCAGQSNMAEFVKRSTNAREELARPPQPLVRQFRTTASLSAATPQRDLTGRWYPTDSTTLANDNYASIPYYFARRLAAELGNEIPVGVIVSAVGATRIESWLSLEGLDPAHPVLGRMHRSALEQREKVAAGTLNVAKGVISSLYNAQVAPHVGTPIRGFLWYQGEANRGDPADRYAIQLRALIGSWRAAWGDTSLPFFYAQIAPFAYKVNNVDPAVITVPDANRPARSAELWENQLLALDTPGTAIVSTFDVGELADIHPTNKKPVGERFAGLALQRVYGRADLLADSPRVVEHRFENGAALLRFTPVGSGLASRDGKPLTWFSLAGADGVFVFADAEIVAPDTIRVRAASVPAPTKVRFGWGDIAQPNLVNSAGLPALPWRSDAP